jgi:hypothetical protein
VDGYRHAKRGDGFVLDRGSSHPFEPTAAARTNAAATPGTAATPCTAAAPGTAAAQWTIVHGERERGTSTCGDWEQHRHRGDERSWR